MCLSKFGPSYDWMALLDADEYLVLQPKSGASTLQGFLAAFAKAGGLVVNWRVFGSSGFTQRPQGSILGNYLR